MASKNTETITRERPLVIGMTEKNKSHTENKETLKILISNQMVIKDNPNLEKEAENLTKVQNQIKISIMDLKVILATSVKMRAKTLLLEINNLTKTIQNMKENLLIRNHNVL